MNRSVLLDLDGTLTDPYEGISRCIVHALGKMNVPIPDLASLGSWIGPPLKKSFSNYLGQHGGGDTDLALAHYRQRYGGVGWRENSVYDGIPRVLSKMHSSGAQLIVATSKPTVYAERIVAHFGLSGWLTAVHGSELDGRRSDKTELLGHIISLHQLSRKTCVMVGDRAQDMVAACNHTVMAVGVLWGFGSVDELQHAGAQCLYEYPRQLRRLPTLDSCLRALN